MGEDQPQTGRRRLTVAEASEILGITVEAVRGRIKRETLEHERDSGTVYVLLDADQPATGPQPDVDQPTDQSQPDDYTDITEELRDRIRYLERQVEEEREARRRADTILAQLSAANAEQARTIRAIEAPQEPPEDAETVEEAPDRGVSHSATGGAREELGAERARRVMAENTLQEGMAEERRRREEAERERDDLRQELHARREPRESPESPGPTDTPNGGGGDAQAATEHQHAQRPSEGVEHDAGTLREWSGDVEGRRRPWWRRLLGG